MARRGGLCDQTVDAHGAPRRSCASRGRRSHSALGACVLTRWPATCESVHAALAAGLTPIICVGETFEENRAGRTGEVVVRQTRAALAGLGAEAVAGLIVAYEPVWAIGTGLAAEPQGAAAVIRDFIRSPISEDFGRGPAERLRVQYGGSVKPDNAAAFFSMEDIDGALVGGACLKAADFVAIIRAAVRPPSE